MQAAILVPLVRHCDKREIMTVVYVSEHEDRVLAPALDHFTGEIRTNLMNLDPADMGSDRARWLLVKIQELSRAGCPVELLTLQEAIAQDGKRERPTAPFGCDFPWLVDLAQQSHMTANHAHYVGTVKAAAHRRRLDAAITKVNQAVQSGAPVEDAARAIYAEFQRYEAAKRPDGPILLADLTQGVYEGWRAISDGEEAGIVLESGGLGEAFGRMKGGELVVVAGRPGMGKTVLAGAVTMDIGIRQRRPVLYLSLEMSAHDMAERIWLAEARLSLADVERDVDSHNDRLALAMARFNPHEGEKAPVWIEAPDMMNIHQVVASAERWAADIANPGAVVIDYVGLIEAGGDSRRHDLLIGSFTAALKGLAKRLNLPVIALFQLNREVGARANKRPQLTDLRDSGSIEQDADKVVMIHREQYYNPQTPLGDLVELLNVKRRRGAPRNGYMGFIGGHLVPLTDSAQDMAAEQVVSELRRLAGNGGAK